MPRFPKPVRRKTYNEPGHAHELTFTCHNRYQFLRSDLTCTWLAESINEARTKHHFQLWAYVFMPEHVHLVIRPDRVPYEISQILTAIKEHVGRRALKHMEEHSPHWLDKISHQKGSRLERSFWLAGGGYDRNVTEQSTLLAMILYIHQNPVRRGLVARPEEWSWSSAMWFEGTGENGLQPDRIPPEWGLMP